MSAVLAIWAALKGWASGFWDFVKAHPWLAAMLLMLAICLWQARAIEGADQQRDKAQSDLATEKKARADDRAAFELAASQAAARWADAFAQQRTQFQQSAEKADHDAQEMVASYAARADDYARRMRLGAVCAAAQGGPGKPATAQQAGAAQGAIGPGADAVVLGRPDYDILIDNTRRLKAAHDWAVEVSQ